MSSSFKDLKEYEKLAIKIYYYGGSHIIRSMISGNLTLYDFKQCIQNYVDLMIMTSQYELDTGISFESFSINMLDEDPILKLKRAIKTFVRVMQNIIAKSSVIKNEVITGYDPTGDVFNDKLYGEYNTYITNDFFVFKKHGSGSINLHFNDVGIPAVFDSTYDILILPNSVFYIKDSKNIYIVAQRDLELTKYPINFDFTVVESCDLFMREYSDVVNIHQLLTSSDRFGEKIYNDTINLISYNLGKLVGRMGCSNAISPRNLSKLTSVNYVNEFLKGLAKSSLKDLIDSKLKSKTIPRLIPRYIAPALMPSRGDGGGGGGGGGRGSGRGRGEDVGEDDDILETMCSNPTVKYVFGESVIKDIEANESDQSFTYKGQKIRPSFNLLGEGSFGEVWKAEFMDASGTRRQFAFKLAKNKSGTIKLRSNEHRFLEEYTDAYECGKLVNMRASNFAILMDVASGDLRQFEGLLTFNQGVKLVNKIKEILFCLAGKDYFYLDIKPANILFTCREGKNIEIMLGDLGSLIPTRGNYTITFPPPKYVRFGIPGHDVEYIKKYQTYCLILLLFFMTCPVNKHKLYPDYMGQFKILPHLIKLIQSTHGDNKYLESLKACYRNKSIDVLEPLDVYEFDG